MSNLLDNPYNALKVKAYVTLKQESREDTGSGFGAWSSSETTVGPFDVGGGIESGGDIAAALVPIVTAYNIDGTGTSGFYVLEYRFTWTFETHFMPLQFTIEQTTTTTDAAPPVTADFVLDVNTNPLVYNLTASANENGSRSWDSVVSFRCPS